MSARAESRAVCALARESGAVAGLVHPLVVEADAAYRLGDWDAAEGAASEAIHLAGETGQHIWHGYALAIRARLDAARGHEAQSRQGARDVTAIAEATGMRSGFRFVHGALGFLAIGLGRVDEAIAELETTAQLAEDSGVAEPTLLPWAPDLIEAYLRAGRPRDAGRVLDTLEQQAGSADTACADALLARCRGMVDDDFDAPFRRALDCHERRPMPFERARTQLAHGRRLHRARRRTEARSVLREAVAGFERLGASPWSVQARDELRSAGARRRARRDDALTAQERRVAAAVARGASNREVAAELFLAPKTIEYHLRQIYRKLEVRSRTQLAASLARDAAPPEE